MISFSEYNSLVRRIHDADAELVAVSKTHPNSSIQALYDMGQRHFAENRTQELVEKAPSMPKDIIWHFIGHLQSKKVNTIAPFVHTVHSVDSEKLLLTINKEAEKNNRIIKCLLQLKIAKEEQKFGFDGETLMEVFERIEGADLTNVEIVGLMGMATFTTDENQIRSEFKYAKETFDKVKSDYPMYDHINALSLGMSGDFQIALEEGSTMVRIGSLLFGARNDSLW